MLNFERTSQNFDRKILRITLKMTNKFKNLRSEKRKNEKMKKSMCTSVKIFKRKLVKIWVLNIYFSNNLA